MSGYYYVTDANVLQDCEEINGEEVCIHSELNS